MDSRIAIYVYTSSTVTISPSSTVELMKMQTDYSAKSEGNVSSWSGTLNPGVWGFVYNGTHGVSYGSSGQVILVTDDYDVQRKTPWPSPPPPPPPPFALRDDWNDHCKTFLVPLGSTFELGDSSGGG